MDIVIYPAVLSAFLSVAAFTAYNWQIFEEKSTPNVATWFIWSAVGVVSAASYFSMTGSVAKSLITITDTLLCLTVFLLALFKRKFARLRLFDELVLMGALLAGIVWVGLEDARTANLVAQGVIVASFLPTIVGLLSGRLKERPLPWLLWSAAFAAASLVVAIDYDGNGYSLVYPLFTGVFMHGLVAFLSCRVRRSSEPFS